MRAQTKSTLTWVLAGAVIAAAVGWWAIRPNGLPAGIVSGNGRIEATEIDIATKTPGRVIDILVREGDFVQAGKVLARMDTDVLLAQQAEAEAQVREAENAYLTAKSIVAQHQAELDVARKRLKRSQRSSAKAPRRSRKSTIIVPVCLALRRPLEPPRRRSRPRDPELMRRSRRWCNRNR